MPVSNNLHNPATPVFTEGPAIRIARPSLYWGQCAQWVGRFHMSPERKNWRVILAGDGPEVRPRLTGMLSRIGCSVKTVESPGDVIDTGLASEPLCFVIDLDSQRYDWLVTALNIRDQEMLSRIPILLTSLDGGRGIEFFRDIDLFGEAPIEYLPGPVSFDELVFQVQRFLSGAENPIGLSSNP